MDRLPEVTMGLGYGQQQCHNFLRCSEVGLDASGVPVQLYDPLILLGILKTIERKGMDYIQVKNKGTQRSALIDKEGYKTDGVGRNTYASSVLDYKIATISAYFPLPTTQHPI